MPLTALSRAFADLFRPGIFSVMLWGIGLTLLLFVGLQAAVFFALGHFAPASVGLPFGVELPLASLLSWGSLLLLPLMAVFLMAPVAAGFAGLFAERVAEAVEQRHYPANIGQPLDFMDGLLASVPIVGLMIVIALVTLMLSPLLGPLTPALFYGANGWLLGREFFQMSAQRHMPEAEATALRRRLSGQVTATGIVIALLLTVPVLNIAVPVLAAAAFTHLYQISASGRPARPYLRG